MFFSFVSDYLLFVPIQRYGCAPVEVARDAAWFESVSQPRARDLLRVGRPHASRVRLRQVLRQQRLERRQVHEEVLWRFDDRWRCADLAARLDEVDRVDELAALVTLVAPSVDVATQRTGALHETVRQKPNNRKIMLKREKNYENDFIISLAMTVFTFTIYYVFNVCAF